MLELPRFRSMWLRRPEGAVLARCCCSHWSKNPNAAESGPFRPGSFPRTHRALPYTSPAPFAKLDDGIGLASWRACGETFFCSNDGVPQLAFKRRPELFSHHQHHETVGKNCLPGMRIVRR